MGDTSWGENRKGTPCDSFYNISQDPDFSDGYHLNSQSACINAGDNSALGLPNFDFDGNPRISVSYVDMGAYEYQQKLFAGGGAKISSYDTASQNKSALSVSKEFALSQNYPNPFNPVTTIQFAIAGDKSPTHVTLKIYNIAGQLVRTLVDEEKTSGNYAITWDGRNNSGDKAASGIYFYQLKSKEFTETKRLTLIK